MTVAGQDNELFERQDELALVEAGVGAAASGRGRLLWIEGPAGIGKTELVRLACHAAARAGLRVCSARGGELEREFPFGVVRQLFEGVLRTSERSDQTAVLSGSARHAAGLFGLPSELSAPDLLPLLHSLYWLTANLASLQPLLVAVDDAHWADVSSLRYLEYLARRLDELSVIVVVASRPSEVRDDADLLARMGTEPNSQTIRPAPLSKDAVALLVEGSLEGPADAEFSRACHVATGGNPFLIHHLLATLREDGVASSAHSAPAVFTTAPNAVTTATRRRLAALSPEATRLAEAVAVLGDEAQLATAAKLAEVGPLPAATACDQLAAAGVLQSSRPLAFVHPLLRSVVYGDISPARRSTQHRRAAELLAGLGLPADQVAAQLLVTEPASDDWVTEMLRQGAAASLAAGDPATAGVLLRRALTEPPPLDLRPALLYELGAAEHRSHSPGAIEHLRQAYELELDRRQRVEILRVLMVALMGAQRVEEVEHLLDAAVEAAATIDPDLGLQLEAEVISVAQISLRSEPWTQARLGRWLGKLSGRTPGERLLLANLCYQTSISAGTASEVAELAEQALGDGALFDEQIADAMPFYLAVYVLASAGRIARASEMLDAARAQALARGSQLGFAMVSLHRSFVELAAGRVGAAEAEADNALRAAGDEQAWPAGFPACVAAMLDALVVQGRLAEARQLLQRHDLLGSLPDGLPQRVLLHGRAQLRLVSGDAVGALGDFDELDRRETALPSLNPWVNNHRLGAIIALGRIGRSDEAAERARAALVAAQHWGTGAAVGRALLALGTVSHPTEAEAQLTEAVTLLAASPARLDHAAALVELGTLRRRCGARATAEATLREGLDLASRLGAGLIAGRARAELVAMGRRPRRSAMAGIDALTASERRVAELAVSGITNREIAQSLFVTARTVEIHLSAVYRKLSVDSRRELRNVLS